MHVAGLRARRRVGHGQRRSSRRSDSARRRRSRPRPRTSRRVARVIGDRLAPSISSVDRVAVRRPEPEARAVGRRASVAPKGSHAASCSCLPSAVDAARDALRAPTTIVVARAHARGAVGSALSSSRRAGSRGGGSWNSVIFGVGVEQQRQRSRSLPSPLRPARRSTSARSSGLFQAVGRRCSPALVEPGDVEHARRAAASLPCRKLRRSAERMTVPQRGQRARRRR